MPRVKIPNNGPPTAPNMVNAACNTPPRYSARKAKAKKISPYVQAANFDSHGSHDGRILHQLKTIKLINIIAISYATDF